MSSTVKRRTMPTVELVYDADCPNASEARAQLLRAFTESGIEARWREWCGDDPEVPPHVRGFGSPTVLVDGKDVAGGVPVERTRSCRIYGHGDGAARGVPPVEAIVAALKASRDPPRGARRRRG
jgi:mercuric ion transport protein